MLIWLLFVTLSQSLADTIYLSGTVSSPVRTETQKIEIADRTIIQTTVFSALEITFGSTITFVQTEAIGDIPFVVSMKELNLNGTTATIKITHRRGNRVAIVGCPSSTWFNGTNVVDEVNDPKCELTDSGRVTTGKYKDGLTRVWVGYTNFCTDCPVDFFMNIHLPIFVGSGILALVLVVLLVKLFVSPSSNKSHIIKVYDFFAPLFFCSLVITCSVIGFLVHSYRTEAGGWECPEEFLLYRVRNYAIGYGPIIFGTFTVLVACVWVCFSFLVCCAPEDDAIYKKDSCVYRLSPNSRARMFFLLLTMFACCLWASVVTPLISVLLVQQDIIDYDTVFVLVVETLPVAGGLSAIFITFVIVLSTCCSSDEGTYFLEKGFVHPEDRGHSAADSVLLAGDF